MTNTVFEVTKRVVDYVIENNIQNLVLVDTDARPFYRPFMEYYKHVHPDLERPKIYFMSPGSEFGNFDTGLEEQHPQLQRRKDRPTLVLDNCVHTGETMQKIRIVLEASGFENVKYGVYTAKSSRAAFELDFRIDYTEIEGPYHCNPMNLIWEVFVEKGELQTSKRKKAGAYMRGICRQERKHLAYQIRKALGKAENELPPETDPPDALGRISRRPLHNKHIEKLEDRGMAPEIYNEILRQRFPGAEEVV